jgi:predicted RNA-binding Zn ribbon-like protein
MLHELDLVTRLRLRASIRRNIQTRKSVQEGAPDRISDLLEEAAEENMTNRQVISSFQQSILYKLWKMLQIL